eukprot:gnl/TRDRNA2_/TRDRNA2_163166_c1_seq1.p1 gnl/TRDRNA2_/TRDRNA2_163166_c1~~gnl/TRDRNA2_/TRDRNA2_163166_c1_seq1.p1  ORF type:complete len:620 (+),score=97.32 gnl/TRDRNA2_/TRDRNA2_163166_c1_seq1:48-1862(+)
MPTAMALSLNAAWGVDETRRHLEIKVPIRELLAALSALEEHQEDAGKPRIEEQIPLEPVLPKYEAGSLDKILNPSDDKLQLSDAHSPISELPQPPVVPSMQVSEHARDVSIQAASDAQQQHHNAAPTLTEASEVPRPPEKQHVLRLGWQRNEIAAPLAEEAPTPLMQKISQVTADVEQQRNDAAMPPPLAAEKSIKSSIVNSDTLGGDGKEGIRGSSASAVAVAVRGCAESPADRSIPGEALTGFRMSWFRKAILLPSGEMLGELPPSSRRSRLMKGAFSKVAFRDEITVQPKDFAVQEKTAQPLSATAGQLPSAGKPLAETAEAQVTDVPFVQNIEAKEVQATEDDAEPLQAMDTTRIEVAESQASDRSAAHVVGDPECLAPKAAEHTPEAQATECGGGSPPRAAPTVVSECTSLAPSLDCGDPTDVEALQAAVAAAMRLTHNTAQTPGSQCTSLTATLDCGGPNDAAAVQAVVDAAMRLPLGLIPNTAHTADSLCASVTATLDCGGPNDAVAVQAVVEAESHGASSLRQEVQQLALQVEALTLPQVVSKKHPLNTRSRASCHTARELQTLIDGDGPNSWSNRTWRRSDSRNMQHAEKTKLKF